jgi:AraC-like protein
MDTTSLSDAQSVHFSTTGIPEPDRVEYWEAYNTATVMPLRCRALQSGFHASRVRTTIGALEVLRTTATSHVIERDAALVRGHPIDQVGVHMILRGEYAYCTSDGVRTLRPGQVLLHRDQPFLLGYTGNSHDLVVSVPPSLYAEFAHGAPPPRSQVVDADGPLGACVTALGRLLVGTGRSETSARKDGRRDGAGTVGGACLGTACAPVHGRPLRRRS